MTADSPVLVGERFNEEGSWILRQFVALEDLRRPPEEYVAKHAHLLGNFSFHLYRYDEPELGDWVRRVGQLLSTDADVERCRELYLPPAELAEIRLREAGEF